MSDDEDSSTVPGTAAPAGRGGAGVQVFVPEDPSPADTIRNDKNSNRGMPSIAGQKEIGGRDGPDPTRFGDWEIKGRCIDF